MSRHEDLINVEGSWIPRVYCEPTIARDDDATFPIKLACGGQSLKGKCWRGYECGAVHFVSVTVNGVRRWTKEFQPCPMLDQCVDSRQQGTECRDSNACDRKCRFLHPAEVPSDKKKATAKALYYVRAYVEAQRQAANDSDDAEEEDWEDEGDDGGDVEEQLEEENVSFNDPINVEGVVMPRDYCNSTLGRNDDKAFPVKAICIAEHTANGCPRGEKCAAVHFPPIVVDGRQAWAYEYRPSPGLWLCLFGGKKGRTCRHASRGTCPQGASKCAFLHPIIAWEEQAHEEAMFHLRAYLKAATRSGKDRKAAEESSRLPSSETRVSAVPSSAVAPTLRPVAVFENVDAVAIEKVSLRLQALDARLREVETLLAEKTYEVDVLTSRNTKLETMVQEARTSLAMEKQARQKEREAAAKAAEGVMMSIEYWERSSATLAKDLADERLRSKDFERRLVASDRRVEHLSSENAEQIEEITELREALKTAVDRLQEANQLAAQPRPEKSDPAVLCNRSDDFFNAGHFVDALREADACIEMHPTYKRAYIAFAKAASALGDFARVASVLKTGLQAVVGGGEQTEIMRSFQTMATVAKGTIAKAFNQWKANSEDQALTTIDQLAALMPMCWEVQFIVVLANIAKSDYDSTALAQARKLLSTFRPMREGHCANFHFASGYFQAWTGDMKKAVEGNFKEALRIDPKHEMARTMVTKCKEALAREEKAEQAMTAGNWRQAMHHYESVCALMKRNYVHCQAMERRACFPLAKLGDWGEVWDRLEHYNGSDDALMMLRAHAHCRLHNSESCRELALHEALALARSRPEHFHADYIALAKYLGMEPQPL